MIREITGRPRPHLPGGLRLAEAIEKVATDDVVVDFRCIRQGVWKGNRKTEGARLNTVFRETRLTLSVYDTSASSRTDGRFANVSGLDGTR